MQIAVPSYSNTHIQQINQPISMGMCDNMQLISGNNSSGTLWMWWLLLLFYACEFCVFSILLFFLSPWYIYYVSIVHRIDFWPPVDDWGYAWLFSAMFNGKIWIRKKKQERKKSSATEMHWKSSHNSYRTQWDEIDIIVFPFCCMWNSKVSIAYRTVCACPDTCCIFKWIILSSYSAQKSR